MRVEWYNGKERVSSETITLSAKVTTISKPVTKACTYKLAAMPLEADGKDALKWEQWRKDKWAQCYNYDVRIPAAGTNWVAGGLTIPKDNTRKYPVYLKFYGVGWDGVCECDQNPDRIIFCVNCHGLPSADATTSITVMCSCVRPVRSNT